MRSRRQTVRLKHIQATDVKQWFQDAWLRRAHLLDDRRCNFVALRVNTIVDRHNAMPDRAAADEAIVKRRNDHLAAGRAGRALKRALQRTMGHLLSELNTLAAYGLEPDGALHHRISVTHQTLASVDSFLALDQPRCQDHADPMLWIAEAVEEAWRDVPGAPKLPLGCRPEAPLTSFVSQAMDAIGLVSARGTAFSLDTISDHLRKRQNRPRIKRHGAAAVGEN